MSRIHYFADGYLLQDEKSPNRQSAWVCMFNPAKRDARLKFTFYLVIDREGMRLKETEWAFILNPNDEVADVVPYAHYSDGRKHEHRFTVRPQRLLPVFMDETVVKNTLFGAKYISSVPVSIQETRLIEEEDRKTIRACFSVMAKIGSLTCQDESLIEA